MQQTIGTPPCTLKQPWISVRVEESVISYLLLWMHLKQAKRMKEIEEQIMHEKRQAAVSGCSTEGKLAQGE